MSSIYDLLAQIKNAVYGKDVRDAIHDSIEQCYDDATGTPESIAGAVADIQAYKEQTDALISNYESQFNTMMADYEDRIDAQVDNLVANVKPNTVVNLWRGISGTEPSGTIDDVYTLSDDISNYDYIDIYAQSSYDTPVRVRVDKSFGNTLAKVVNVQSSGYPHEDNTFYLLNETHIYFAGNGNEGVVTYTLQVTTRNGEQTTYEYNDPDMAPLTIVRIDGIKVGADASAEVADIRVGEDGTVYQTAGAAVRGQIADVKADLEELQNDAGVTAELKSALLDIASNIAYINQNGQTLYDNLYNALYPNASSITCVYTQTGTVYTTDTLDSLKDDLVVTAHYSDSTTKVLKPSDYTLTGTLSEGTSTIVVHYGDLMTSFTVNVTARTVSSISAVYTQSGTVYSDDSTDSLKSDLVVTAIFNDSSSEILNNNDYSLSGSLDSATSTITVTYESKTTTFTVSVTLVGSTNYADDLANWRRSATPTASYANGKITMKCSQANANNWSMWVFDRAKTLWDTVNGKKLRIRITMDSPDWVGDISTTSPLNLVNVGVSIYKNASITSGSDRQKSQGIDKFVLDSTSQTFEYIFDADISNFDTGTGTPTNVSTFGVFVYDASANTVNITDCEIVEVLTT